ncbi:MAG: hypothetical protein PHT07_23990 [Paludibacter sp.]|nr:hypothetical protein [Paludibacter sp.]
MKDTFYSILAGAVSSYFAIRLLQAINIPDFVQGWISCMVFFAGQRGFKRAINNLNNRA